MSLLHSSAIDVPLMTQRTEMYFLGIRHYEAMPFCLMDAQKRNSPPPEVMTMGKAMPILIVAGIFDAIRIFFELFWFWGPAMFAVGCTIVGNSWIGTTLATVGGKIVAVACSAAAVAGGVALSETTTTIGVIMADAMAFIGFLVLGLWILMENARILKAIATAPFWFAGAFAIGETPIIGSFPVFSFVLWRLYKIQIRVEQAALKKWEEEHAAELLQERQQQAARLMQIQDFRSAQVEEQGDIDAEEYNRGVDEMEDDSEIPEGVRKAA